MELTNAPGTVVYTYNSGTQESDTRILEIEGQSVIDRWCWRQTMLDVRHCFKKSKQTAIIKTEVDMQVLETKMMFQCF